jgi:hypothetical protein
MVEPIDVRLEVYAMGGNASKCSWMGMSINEVGWRSSHEYGAERGEDQCRPNSTGYGHQPASWQCDGFVLREYSLLPLTGFGGESL